MCVRRTTLWKLVVLSGLDCFKYLGPQVLKTIHFLERLAIQYHMHSIPINITRAPHNFTLTWTLTFFFCILYRIHSPVYTTSPPSQPLVLYHLQITAGLYQTCHHSYLATPALSQGLLVVLLIHHLRASMHVGKYFYKISVTNSLLTNNRFDSCQSMALSFSI